MGLWMCKVRKLLVLESLWDLTLAVTCLLMAFQDYEIVEALMI